MASEDYLQSEWTSARAAFAKELKAHRQAGKLTMPQLVDKAGHGLSVNAYKKYEWLRGEQLPAEDRLQQLVAALGDGATALVGLHEAAEEARANWKQAQRFPDRLELLAQRRYEPWEGYSYRQLFRRSVDAVVHNIRHEIVDGEELVGWRHFLENDSISITPMASAYGLRVLLMANHTRAEPSVGRIRDSILALELDEGGWKTRTQNTARVELYGPVLHALRLAGLSDADLQKRVNHYEEILDPDFDQAAWLHITVLTTACNTLANVAPESERIRELLDALRAAAITAKGGEVYWTKSVDPKRASVLSASVAHTARAICTIAQTPPELFAEMEDLALPAVRWLAQHTEYHSSDELIERSGADDRDYLAMRHFTAGWVGRALALGSAWTDVNPTALRLAEDQVLKWVQPDGLWRWESGEQPIWMTFQGLRALREIAIAEHDMRRRSG